MKYGEEMRKKHERIANLVNKILQFSFTTSLNIYYYIKNEIVILNFLQEIH